MPILSSPTSAVVFVPIVLGALNGGRPLRSSLRERPGTFRRVDIQPWHTVFGCSQVGWRRRDCVCGWLEHHHSKYPIGVSLTRKLEFGLRDDFFVAETHRECDTDTDGEDASTVECGECRCVEGMGGWNMGKGLRVGFMMMD